MKIRAAERDEVKIFQLYSDDNEGDSFVVAEKDGKAVGFAQFEDWTDTAKIHFMESNEKGAGRAMVEWFRSNYDVVGVINATETARPFYAHLGFDDVRKNGYAGQVDMYYYAE